MSEQEILQVVIDVLSAITDKPANEISLDTQLTLGGLELDSTDVILTLPTELEELLGIDFHITELPEDCDIGNGLLTRDVPEDQRGSPIYVYDIVKLLLQNSKVKSMPMIELPNRIGRIQRHCEYIIAKVKRIVKRLPNHPNIQITNLACEIYTFTSRGWEGDGLGNLGYSDEDVTVDVKISFK